MPFGSNVTGFPTDQQDGAGLDPQAIIQQLLALGQQDQQVNFPQPQAPSRANQIGAIILGALGNPQGLQMLERRRQEAQQAQMQGAVQQRMMQQGQAQNQRTILANLLATIDRNRREQRMAEQFQQSQAGLEGRFAAGQDLTRDQMTQQAQLASDREVNTERRFQQSEGRMISLAEQMAQLRRDQMEFQKQVHADAMALRKTGRPLPAGQATEIGEMNFGVTQAQKALSLFNELGQPGTNIGSSLIPRRFRPENMKRFDAIWTSVRAPIRKAFSGTAVSESERKDLEGLLVRVGTDAQSTEFALRSIIDMLNSKRESILGTLGQAGFSVDELKNFGLPDEFEDLGDLNAPTPPQ